MSSNDATVQTILESEDLKLSTTEMYGAGHEVDPPHRKRAPLLEHKSAQGRDALFLLVVAGSRLGDDRRILNKKNTHLHDSKNIHAPETTANKKSASPRQQTQKKRALECFGGAFAVWLSLRGPVCCFVVPGVFFCWSLRGRFLQSSRAGVHSLTGFLGLCTDSKTQLQQKTRVPSAQLTAAPDGSAQDRNAIPGTLR